VDNAEFLYHLNIIKDLIKKPHVRIILLHPPYNESQQIIIDSISRQSKHIIGQLERKPPILDAAKEIDRLISSHKDPFIAADELQYVVLGRQKPKSNEIQ
jgi:hypothetical protein